MNAAHRTVGALVLALLAVILPTRHLNADWVTTMAAPHFIDNSDFSQGGIAGYSSTVSFAVYENTGGDWFAGIAADTPSWDAIPAATYTTLDSTPAATGLEPYVYFYQVDVTLGTVTDLSLPNGNNFDKMGYVDNRLFSPLPANGSTPVFVDPNVDPVTPGLAPTTADLGATADFTWGFPHLTTIAGRTPSTLFYLTSSGSPILDTATVNAMSPSTNDVASAAAVPEPGTMVLVGFTMFGCGLASIGRRYRRKRAEQAKQ